MLELQLLRHAKSSWDDEQVRDHDRELNARGLRSAPAVGRYLRDHDVCPDLVLSSTAKRAAQTAELCVQAAGCEAAILRLEDLYLAAPAELLANVRKHGGEAKTVLLVAHNPGLEQLATSFAKALTPFPTAALARVSIDLEDWASLDGTAAGELRELVRADKLEED